MKVLFLTNNVIGVNYWRIYQFFLKMKELGVDAYVYGYSEHQNRVGEWEYAFKENPNKKHEVFRLMQNADIIVMQYIHLPETFALIEMFQEQFHKKILCEIDDEVIDTPAYNPAYRLGWNPGNMGERVVIEQLKASDGIIVSTPFLKKHYTMFNKNICIVPNSIDFNVWKGKRKKYKKLRIGWVGGANHEEDLRVLQGVIPVIQNKYKNVEFVFVHGTPQYIKDIKGVKHIKKWVDIKKYPHHVRDLGFDIGLAPLETNKFNMSKSNLRWLEYSSYKIPTVASFIEPYSKSIEAGHNGMLCESTDDWINNISYLIDNEAHRLKIGNRAFETVQKNYNIDTTTKKYVKFLEKQL